MKTLLPLLIAVLAANASFSQQTKLVIKRGESSTEEYHVVVGSKDVRHGTYVRYTRSYPSVSVLESGSYANGEKSGLWEYYYEGIFIPIRGFTQNNSLKEKGHYAYGKKNGLWVSYHRDTVANKVDIQRFGNKRRIDSVNVQVEQRGLRPRTAGNYVNDKRYGDWYSFGYEGGIIQKYNFSKARLLLDSSLEDTLRLNRNRPPLYVGGLPCLENEFFESFKFGNAMATGRECGKKVIVSFLVDAMGKRSDPKVLESDAPVHFQREALQAVRSLADGWIPALRDGQPIPAEYRVACEATCRTDAKGHRYYQVLFRPLLDRDVN